MYAKYDDDVSPPRSFANRADAQAAADAITNTPRQGIARPQFYGYMDCWIVEAHPRNDPYSNAAVLRENGELAKYN